MEKRKQAGTRVKHLKTAALVAGPARTGKAARLAQRRDRRNTKAALVRPSCLRACVAPTNTHANPTEPPLTRSPVQTAQGLLDTQMEQAPKLKAPAAPAAAPSAMQE